MRGLVTSEHGLKVRPKRHSFMAWVNTVEIRQSSRFTVDGDTDASLAFLHSAISGPVIDAIGRLNSG